MKNQLRLLDRIISGDLSPANYTHQHIVNYQDLLPDHAISYHMLIEAKFRKDISEQYSLTEYREYTLTESLPFPLLSTFAQDNNRQLLDELINKIEGVVHLSSIDLRNYSLERIHNIAFLKIIVEQKIHTDSLEKDRFYFYHTLLCTQLSQVIDYIKEQSFNITVKELKHVIAVLHETINKLVRLTLKYFNKYEQDKLYKFSDKYAIEDVYKLIYQHLENLLCYLAAHYPDYISKNTLTPYRIRTRLADEINLKVDTIEKKLINSSLDKHLQDILDKIFKQWPVSIKSSAITYSQMEYYKRLVDEFYQLAQICSGLTKTTIIDCLYEINFNSVHLFTYLTKDIEKQIEEEHDLIGKINRLYYLLKIYNQKLVIKGTSYKGELPSIKDQLCNWLKEEILFYKRLLNEMAVEGSVHQKIRSSEDVYGKLTTSLSVAGLSYFFKVLYEAGIITNKNQRDIARFISSGWSTGKTERISYDSVSSKYYNVEEATRLAIKDILIKMLNYVNKAK